MKDWQFWLIFLCLLWIGDSVEHVASQYPRPPTGFWKGARVSIIAIIAILAMVIAFAPKH